MRARLAPVPNTACATCGGPTTDGRPVDVSGACSWRLCAACGPLRTSDSVMVSAVRVRHGHQAADDLTTVGVRAVSQAAGVTLQGFAVHVSSPRNGGFAPGEPWEHEAAQVARLAEHATALAAARRAVQAQSVRSWPAHCLSCPTELAPQPGRTAPLCDDCLTAWRRTHDSLHGLAA